MQSNQTIKLAARTINQQLPGKYQIFFLPIIVSLLNSWLSSGNQLLTIDFSQKPFITHINISAGLLSLSLQLLLTFAVISAIFTLLPIIRYRRVEVLPKNHIRAFANEFVGKILAVLLLRWLYLLPAFALSCLGLVLEYYPYLTSTTTVVGLAITVAGFIVVVIGLTLFLLQYYQYSQAEFLLVDSLSIGHYPGARHILKQSRLMMKGHKQQRFTLDLSFIGWWLLGLLTFHLTDIYFLPYYTTTRVLFYEDLRHSLYQKKDL